MDRSQDNEIMQQQQGDHPPFGFSILRLRAFTVFKNQESSENTGAAALPSATTPALRTLFCTSRWGASVVVLLGLFLGLVVYSVRTDSSLFQNAIISAILPKLSSPLPMPYPPITCPNATTPAPTCSRSPHTPPPSMSLNADLSPVCPGYFRYIHDDLKPWSERGITRQLVETANRTANFRLTVVGGRLYLTRYTPFEKRDVFTWWGVLQLLRRYPGRLPDVDLMFDADDRPVVVAAAYPGDKRSQAPPLFRYCKDDETLDIPFPDWSFWGWPEINIKPWGPLSEELEAANRRLEWSKREPYAFWRGNPSMSATRQEVMNCNVSQEKDWNARLYAHDWISESNAGYKHSILADQCNYRYKIYLDGIGWSVSQKYIMACDSTTLRIDSRYIDFFTRGLEPLRHYWPMKTDASKYCPAIKFAVDWGNRNSNEARAMGKEASEFMLRQLRMEYVYDYMFHVFSEYAKLLRYKPEVPLEAVELCVEGMMCERKGLEREFMEMSMVNVSSTLEPCTLPGPLDSAEVEAIWSRGEEARKHVDAWERQGF